MKFRLKTSTRRYYKKDIKNIDVYKSYGFEFTYQSTYDEFLIHKNPEIEINSIEDLIKVSKDFNTELIISSKSKKIQIYDSFIE